NNKPPPCEEIPLGLFHPVWLWLRLCGALVELANDLNNHGVNLQVAVGCSNCNCSNDAVTFQPCHKLAILRDVETKLFHHVTVHRGRIVHGWGSASLLKEFLLEKPQQSL